MLKYKLLHFSKPFRSWHEKRWYIVRQYLIVGLVVTGLFLPVRLVFYTYVSHNWLGNLGVMSVIAIVMFILVEKNKLGRFGVYFQNRVRRLVFHRIFWFAVFSIIMNIIFWGFWLWEIDKGEFQYADKRNELLAIAIYGEYGNNGNVTLGQLGNQELPVTERPMTESLIEMGLYPPPETMIWWGHLNQLEKARWATDFVMQDDSWYFFDVMFSVILFVINVEYGAWASHFTTVFLLEEIEALGLLFFYRKAYFKKVGYSWQEMGFETKPLRKFIRKNKGIENRKNAKRWLFGFR